MEEIKNGDIVQLNSCSEINMTVTGNHLSILDCMYFNVDSKKFELIKIPQCAVKKVTPSKKQDGREYL
jgi:hypothetical protein